MAFEYEILTEERKAEYPERDGELPKGWYIDKERNICIWGGLQAKHWMEMAYGNYNWCFKLGINHQWFEIIVSKGEGSKKFSEKPYQIKWDEIISITSHTFDEISQPKVIALFKEALNAWGGGYNNNTKWHPDYEVTFNF